jgi:hypothetical protein
MKIVGSRQLYFAEWWLSGVEATVWSKKVLLKNNFFVAFVYKKRKLP